MLTAGASPRLGRVLLVSFALVANLIAIGVPVLHGWAHGGDHGHHEMVAEVGEPEHSHGDVHPLSLHDDCLLIHRLALDLAPALPPARTEFVSFATPAAPAVHAVLPMSSRAPPAPGQARAPPLV